MNRGTWIVDKDGKRSPGYWERDPKTRKRTLKTGTPVQKVEKAPKAKGD